MAKRASINEVADLEEVEIPLLGEIYSSEANFWTAIGKVDGHETHLKLDTGAAVSIVSDKEPQRLPANEIAADFKRSRRHHSISCRHLSSHADI